MTGEQFARCALRQPYNGIRPCSGVRALVRDANEHEYPLASALGGIACDYDYYRFATKRRPAEPRLSTYGPVAGEWWTVGGKHVVRFANGWVLFTPKPDDVTHWRWVTAEDLAAEGIPT